MQTTNLPAAAAPSARLPALQDPGLALRACRLGGRHPATLGATPMPARRAG
jgi:hypothetical protein